MEQLLRRELRRKAPQKAILFVHRQLYMKSISFFKLYIHIWAVVVPINVTRPDLKKSGLSFWTFLTDHSTSPGIWSIPMTFPFSPSWQICSRDYDRQQIFNRWFVLPKQPCTQSDIRCRTRHRVLYFREPSDLSILPEQRRAEIIVSNVIEQIGWTITIGSHYHVWGWNRSAESDSLRGIHVRVVGTIHFSIN